ncbi:MAG: hypothetical protein HYZ44_11895 [Bacteroidetes bacterium]|nr:hypothetical protein [Bacteroidota bacterium]
MAISISTLSHPWRVILMTDESLGLSAGTLRHTDRCVRIHPIIPWESLLPHSGSKKENKKKSLSVFDDSQRLAVSGTCMEIGIRDPICSSNEPGMLQNSLFFSESLF